MQMIGFVGLFVSAAAAVAGVSISLYAALPKGVLNYAEYHGRFQGLRPTDRLANGTRAGRPPAGRPAKLIPEAVAR